MRYYIFGVIKVRELSYGVYRIKPDTKKTRLLYQRRGPHLLRCSCPGCQNFFRSVPPYQNELAASLAPLGIAWDKPDRIEVSNANRDSLTYTIRYSFYGSAPQCPHQWETTKNELGSINIRNPRAVYELNNCMSFVFTPAKNGKLRLYVTASLPWLMETLNCIYSPDVSRPEKKIPSRGKRIFSAVKHIYSELKK